MAITIIITQEFYNQQQIVDALDMVGTQVKHGLTRGKSPDWHLEGEDE